MSATAVNVELKNNKKKLLKTKEANEELEILNKITEIKKELDSTLNVFDYCTDEDLIDSCIFNINALNMQYSYYIRLCKEKGFREKAI